MIVQTYSKIGLDNYFPYLILMSKCEFHDDSKK